MEKGEKKYFMIQERSIPLYVILHIVTCGLFGLFWMACLTDDTSVISGEQGTSGVMSVILTICTCGIYGLYWAYKCGEKLDRAKQQKGQPASNGGVLYLLVYIFGGFIAYALIQNELNNLLKY